MEKISNDNTYTNMQKSVYAAGTTNHEEHNKNEDYWNILLGNLKNTDYWKDKSALDFACGKGRNVVNINSLANWKNVDGIDISQANIDFCKNLDLNNSSWYCNNGIDLSELKSESYDFVMSTIALQHISVYEIRKGIIEETLRVLKSGGLFSFQMGFGEGLADSLGRSKSSYYENIYNAQGTNSDYDVRIQNEKEVIEDLLSIGFVDIETAIRDSFSDLGHPQWIYVKAYKKK